MTDTTYTIELPAKTVRDGARDCAWEAVHDWLPGAGADLRCDITNAVSAALDRVVDHLQGHVAANFLEEGFEPPFICLLASGGHTLIARVTDHRGYETLGQTLDDAAGEAFDKGVYIVITDLGKFNTNMCTHGIASKDVQIVDFQIISGPDHCCLLFVVCGLWFVVCGLWCVLNGLEPLLYSVR